MKRVTHGVMAVCLFGGLLFCCIPPKGPEGPVSVGGSLELPKLPQSVSDPLIRTFEKQARGIDADQQKAFYAKYVAHPKVPVRVAIVDLVPGEHAPPKQSAHHEAVARVISSLLCQGPNNSECNARVRVASRPAGDNRILYGGENHYPSVSLDQLHQTLSQILAEGSAGGGRLIVYVAVGVDPIKLNPDDVRIAPLVDVLKRASCMGALVIAPAGNLTGTDGPLVPAAFETMSAPTDSECEGLKVPRSQKTSEKYTPLVYAVGALDERDQRLATDRRWGEPRLAADGLSVLPPGPPGMPLTLAISGTSGAGAIVGGVAAAVWTAKPDLDAHQVMAHVYDGGVRLDGAFKSKRAQTEFCLGHAFGPCPYAVHRVFLCGALASVLPDEKFTCNMEPSTSLEPPVWPAELLPTKHKPAIRCAVTGCDVPSGTASAQRPAGAVPQQPISGCPGCKLSVGGQRVSGIITWLGNVPVMSSALVRTFGDDDLQINADYQLPPWFPADATFSVPMIVTGPAHISAAIMGVTHPDENGLPTTDWIGLRVR